MTRTPIKARDIVKDVLNNNCLDPYPSVRTGNQFLDESDGINLTRANTFPKGFIFIDKEIPHQAEHFHTSGWERNTQRFLLHYFVKDRIHYTDGTGSYMDRDYALFMKDEITDTLRDNIALGSGYYVQNIEKSETVHELINQDTALPFKLFEVIIPFNIKWVNTFG